MFRQICFATCLAVASAGRVLMDAKTGSLQVASLPSSVQTSGIVTIIASPGTPSHILDREPSDALTLDAEQPPRLICRGATLTGTSDAERTSLATCSLLGGAILIDGITEGDIEAGLQNSRHARTLTAVFRARIKLGSESSPPQTLLLGVLASSDDDIDPAAIGKEVKALYQAAAAEKKGSPSFEDVYNLQVVPVASSFDAQKAVEMASSAAQSMETPSMPLAAALSEAHHKVRDSGVGAIALDPPHIAQAFVAVGNAFNKQSRTARARIAAWKSRVARGLWVDGFGPSAEGLRKKVLGTFDGETLSAAGLPLVAPYRLEMRSQLQSLLDVALQEIFAEQIANLERATLKRFTRQLLQTLDEPAESVVDSNAALLRKEAFTFETVVDDLQVPSLGLTKDRPVRIMSAKLNDALMTFPDSPVAKIQRTKKVSKVVKRERKPSQRAIDIGLDLVAVLRPDGFGSLQGFCGYQLGGNSLTFGIHNDADDPQVIAQFGGVRPPLLRVQPKLRVDVEL